MSWQKYLELHQRVLCVNLDPVIATSAMSEPSETRENGVANPDGIPTQTEDNAPAEIEADVDTDLNPPNPDQPTMNIDNAGETNEETAAHKDIPPIETRIPAKKDASLREFLNQMDDYAPIVSSPLPHTELRPIHKIISM